MAKQDLTVELFYSAAWHDVTTRVYTRDSVTINHGSGDEQEGVVPSNASLTFDNRDGEMNPENRKSSLFGLIGHNTPIRITVGSDVRFNGQVVSWKPRRAIKGDAWVHVQAQGTIRRLGQGEAVPLRSALFRSISGVAPDAFTPHDYWPMEDGSESTLIASGISGRTVGTFEGPVTFAASGPLGSAPVLQAEDGFEAILPIASYTDLGRWAVSIVVNIPAEPASTTTLLEVPVAPVAGGTLASWRLQFVPGSPSEIRWQGYNSAGSAVVGRLASEQLGVGFAATEADFYGNWWMITVGSEQDGTDSLAWLGYSDGTTSNSGPHVQLGNTSAASSVHQPIADRAVITADASLDGVGIGHLAVFVDTAFNFLTYGFTNTRAVSGWISERAGARFERLCDEEDIVSTIVGTSADTQLMGPQFVDTLLNLFDETARTDAGVIHDTRSQPGLTFRTGRSLYNQTPVTLDFDAGEIGEPLEPDLDDLGRTNLVIASRRNGSEAIATDDTGPLGVATIGAYKTQVDINPSTDAVLPQHAHYHLILGTDPDPRYPQVVVDLDANPDLASDVSAIDVGDLIGLQSLPADLGQPSADLLALGYTEVIGSHRRVITFNTRPGAILSNVGQLDGDANACLQTAGAELAAAITAEQVSFDVATTSDPLFTTSPPTGAQIIVADREVMTVTGIAHGIDDGFARTVSNSWGTDPTSGLVWSVVSGTAADHSVASSRAQHNMNTRNLNYIDLLDLGFSPPVWDVILPIRPGVVATGSDFRVAIELRSANSSNDWARWDVEFRTSGVVAARHRRQIAGVQTNYSYVTMSFTYGASDVVWSRLLLDGDDMYGKAWLTNLADEPTRWDATELNGASGVPAGTQLGVRTFINSANTNALPLLVEFDNFRLQNPQKFTVTRDPDQRMVHADAASVKAYRPLRLTL